MVSPERVRSRSSLWNTGGVVEPRNQKRPAWVEWLFADRSTGQIVILQAPNVALWLFLAATLASWVFSPQARLAFGLDVVATAALLWWAGDEILRGVNPWRRGLGSVILILTVLGSVRTLIGFG